MDTLLSKSLSSGKDPPSNLMVRRTINKVLGLHSETITFINFRRFAGEAKIHTSTSRYIQRELHLSDLAVTNITSRLLLYFIQSFKIHIWKPRCVKLKSWEKDHGIRSPHLNTPASQRQRRRILQNELFDDPEDNIIIYDDNIRSINTHSRHDDHINFTRLQRRIAALPRTWQIMQRYAEDNLLPTWISKSSNYFNRKIKLIEEWIT